MRRLELLERLATAEANELRRAAWELDAERRRLEVALERRERDAQALRQGAARTHLRLWEQGALKGLAPHEMASALAFSAACLIARAESRGARNVLCEELRSVQRQAVELGQKHARAERKQDAYRKRARHHLRLVRSAREGMAASDVEERAAHEARSAGEEGGAHGS